MSASLSRTDHGGTGALIRLTHDPIDLVELHESVADPACGAVVSFVGTVRSSNRGTAVTGIEYHAYESMALREMERIARDVRERHGARKVSIVHRVGRLEVSEASVAIAISFPHRREAFEALRIAIDSLKETVPIWKKESYADGTSVWLEGS